jgi:DNA-binding CsgD family transcriptional regulator
MLFWLDGLRPRYSMHINPLPTVLQDHTGARVVLLIASLGRDAQRHRVRELSDLFALTQAEARLANCLLQGYSLQEIARSRGITYESARFTLRQVCAKVGVHKQSELVALLAAVVSGVVIPIFGA